MAKEKTPMGLSRFIETGKGLKVVKTKKKLKRPQKIPPGIELR